jgi:hypothetical protein
MSGIVELDGRRSSIDTVHITSTDFSRSLFDFAIEPPLRTLDSLL